MFASANYLHEIIQKLHSQGHTGSMVLRDIYRGEFTFRSMRLGIKSSSIALLTSDICGFLVTQFVSHIAH